YEYIGSSHCRSLAVDIGSCQVLRSSGFVRSGRGSADGGPAAGAHINQTEINCYASDPDRAFRQVIFAQALSTGVRKYGDMMRNHKDTKKGRINDLFLAAFLYVFVSLWFLPYVTVIPNGYTKLTRIGRSRAIAVHDH